MVSNRRDDLVAQEHARHGLDPSIDCSDPSWVAWVVLVGAPMLLVYVIGVPVGLLFALRKYVATARKAGGDEAIGKDSVIILGFLYNGFEPEYYYWEVRSASCPDVVAFVRAHVRYMYRACSW